METAVEISRLGWDRADTVIIASGSSYPDALAGVPLSCAADSPVLLTVGQEGAGEALLAEVKRLGAGRAYILGGTSAVSEAAERDLEAMGVSCIRLAGEDRFATSVEVAKELYRVTGESFDTLYFASARNFPDALAISPVAAVGGNPILYIDPEKGLPEKVSDYVTETGCTAAVLPGGTSAVSESSAGDIASLGLTLERISGIDRFATARAVAERFAGCFEGEGIALATGRDFPDALAGGAHAAKIGIPVLLTGNNAPSELLECASGRGSGSVYVYGGTAAVPEHIAQAVAEAMN